VTSHKLFTWLINIVIVLSSLLLVFESPLSDQTSTKKKVINGLETGFTMIFVLEAVCKIIALGFFRTSLTSSNSRRRAYF